MNRREFFEELFHRFRKVLKALQEAFLKLLEWVSEL